MKKPISMIVAIAENYAIGKNNQLLWHISNDLKHFKKLTEDHNIIMGKNTFYSLPKRPLPKRTNIVLTRDSNFDEKNIIIVHSIEEAIAEMNYEKENFIIGGGSIYQQFMPLADKLYITRIHQEFEADTFFPKIKQDEWKLVEKTDFNKDPQTTLKYSFETYVRK